MFFVESSSTWPITVGIVSKKKRGNQSPKISLKCWQVE